MTDYSLFPKMLRAGRPARPFVPSLSLSAEEISIVRMSLQAGAPVQCQRCESRVTVDGPRGRGRAAAWLIACPECTAVDRVRVEPDPAPAAPKFDRLTFSGSKAEDLRRDAPIWTMAALAQVVLLGGWVIATMPEREMVDAAQEEVVMVALDWPEQSTEEAAPPSSAPRQPRTTPITAPQIAWPEIDLGPVATTTVPIAMPTSLSHSMSSLPPMPNTLGLGTAAASLGGAAVEPNRTYGAAFVDEPPERLYGPEADYPEMLRRARIEGWVVMEFIVSIGGKPEPGTINTLRTTHREFERAATRVIERSVYRPGIYRGQAVRTLVEQRFDFSIALEDR